MLGSISGFHPKVCLPHPSLLPSLAQIPHIPHSSECNCGSICPHPLYTPPPSLYWTQSWKLTPESKLRQAPYCERGGGDWKTPALLSYIWIPWNTSCPLLTCVSPGLLWSFVRHCWAGDSRLTPGSSNQMTTGHPHHQPPPCFIDPQALLVCCLLSLIF